MSNVRGTTVCHGSPAVLPRPSSRHQTRVNGLFVAAGIQGGLFPTMLRLHAATRITLTILHQNTCQFLRLFLALTHAAASHLGEFVTITYRLTLL